MKEIFYMKEWFKHILPLACIGLMSFLWVSCSSDDNDGEPTPPTVESEKTEEGIGTYRFRGIDHQITSGVFSIDETGGVTCIFSPEDLAGSSITTYFSIYLAAYWLGNECNTVTDNLWKNIDYVFTYEDPFYYYSRYQDITGKIYIKRNSDTNLTVNLNVRFHDNVHFKVDVTADLIDLSAAGTKAISTKVMQRLQHKEVLKGYVDDCSH